MPEAPPAAAAQSLTKKSLLRRISSPFSTPTRTVADFVVDLDDPHKRYGPGDIARGNVILRLVKPTRVTHLVICLHGFVQVYRNPGAAPSEGFRAFKNVNGKGKNKSTVYFGNGFGSIFEEEAILCGDGRLDEGNYKFEFNLRFPSQSFPSSIDFERGTVSYMITATLTRPSSISPVMFHDHKIYYNERIDVAQLLPPAPVVIELEPVIRKTKSRSKAASKRRLTQTERVNSDDGSPITQPSLSRLSTPAQQRSPSPSQRSQRSVDSRPSNGAAISERGSNFRSRRPSDSASTLTATSGGGQDGRLITVSIEALKGGVLRGELIPVHIVIEHTKSVKSMQGVIVTLYRQAKVDMHPELPVAATTDGERRRREDYYPKSLTGLGGLSLSSAGSSHTFRKDLAQVAVPLLIDPVSLRAELNPKVRVPEHCFPTLTSAPGAMISFRYYLEVVIDVQGKFRGTSDRQQLDVGSTRYPESSLDSAIDSEGRRPEIMLHNSDFTPFIDTDPIRRDKAVASAVLEVIVGTENSLRVKGKARADTYNSHDYDNGSAAKNGRSRQYSDSNAEAFQRPRNGYVPYRGANGNTYAYGEEHYAPEYYEQGQWDGQYGEEQYWDESYDYYEQPPEFDPADISYDADVPEKERLQRAEAALLPSQPPEEDEGATTVPSPGTSRDGTRAQAPWHITWAPEAGSAPRYTPPAEGTRPENAPTDDKEELARRDLEQQASAPPEEDAGGSEAPPPVPLVPSEQDILHRPEGEQGDATAAHLPRYE